MCLIHRYQSITLEVAAGIIGVTENVGSKFQKSHDGKKKNTKITVFKTVVFYNISFKHYNNIYK